LALKQAGELGSSQSTDHLRRLKFSVFQSPHCEKRETQPFSLQSAFVKEVCGLSQKQKKNLTLGPCRENEAGKPKNFFALVHGNIPRAGERRSSKETKLLAKIPGAEPSGNFAKENEPRLESPIDLHGWLRINGDGRTLKR
jgi:hypothetical protein